MSGDREHEDGRDPRHGESGPGHETQRGDRGPGGGRETPEGATPERNRAEHGGTGRDGSDRDGSAGDGPERERTVQGRSEEDRPGQDLLDQDLLDLDEQALRLLLHDVVRNVEPSPDALDRLHRAVPARRARRRQLTAGAVAAVLVLGVATPALMQSGVVARVMDGMDGATNAASSQRHDEATRAGGRGGSPGGHEPGGKHTGGEGEDDPSKPEDSAGPDSPATPESNDTLAPTSPSCLRSQLGDGGSNVGPADINGQVYGTFRIVNVSDSPCRVEGPDTVSATAVGGAEPSGISVVSHTPGDRAARLPDPVTEPGSIILEPGQAYVVQFAWVPREGGGPTGCRSPEPDPTTGGPTGGPGGDPGGDPGGTGTDPGGTTTGGSTAEPGSGDGSEGGDTVEEPPGDGTSPQLGYDTSGGGDGSVSSAVVLRYVPAAGEPRIGNVEIPNACAGTVYRTGPLPPGPE